MSSRGESPFSTPPKQLVKLRIGEFDNIKFKITIIFNIIYKLSEKVKFCIRILTHIFSFVSLLVIYRTLSKLLVIYD